MTWRLFVALVLVVTVGNVSLAGDGDVARYSGAQRSAMVRQLEAQEELLARRAEGTLRSFYRQQWNIVERSTPRQDNWHIDAMCDHLQACVADAGEIPGITRLAINVPPRNSKSTTTSVAFPAWVWGPRNLPGKRFIYSSYRLSLARRDSRYTRNVITSPWYQQYWGDRFQLLRDQRTKDRYDNDQTGYRMIGSFRGGVTGEGANILVVDDPIDTEKAESVNDLERCIEVWEQSLKWRLNDQKRDVAIIIMQRVAENDLCGHVLSQGGWQHLRLPAKFEIEERCRTFVYVKRVEAEAIAGAAADGANPESGLPVPRFSVVTPDHVAQLLAAATRPLPEQPPCESGVAPRDCGGSTTTEAAAGYTEKDINGSAPAGYDRVLFYEDPRTEEGEPLNPGRFPREFLDGEEEKNPWTFASQQQQRPAPRGGQIFKEAYWRYYDELPQDVDADGRATPRTPDHGALSFDLAFKDLKTSDYVGAMAGLLYGPDIYILPNGYEMKRLGFAGACDLIEQWTSLFPTISAKVVEDAANGPAVVEHLQQVIDGLILVKPDGGKIARAYAAEPTCRSGHVYLPNPVDPKTGAAIAERAWVEKWKKNAAIFPKGKNDDDVDAFTQLVNYLKGTHSAMLEYLKQLRERDKKRAEATA